MDNYSIIISNWFKSASFLLLLISCVRAPDIIDRPIVFDEERIDLTLQYMEDRYDLVQTNPVIEPKMIVVHYTVIPTLEETIEAFNSSRLPETRSGISGAGTLNVSSQFLIDQDGTIYRLMPENYMARHVIGLNHCAIGIENVGGTKEVPLNKKQLEANIKLIRYLESKYDINYLIGHEEYTLFENHELWLEKDDSYRTEKSDPGEQFMNDIRAETLDLGFMDLPDIR